MPGHVTAMPDAESGPLWRWRDGPNAWEVQLCDQRQLWLRGVSQVREADGPAALVGAMGGPPQVAEPMHQQWAPARDVEHAGRIVAFQIVYGGPGGGGPLGDPDQLDEAP